MIKFNKHSGIYTLEATQELPISLEEAWEFFTSPANLTRITPKHMGFEITSGYHGKTYAGQIITYKVSPLPGIRMSWVTEITHVDPGKYFVDEQRYGPYSMWHHEHIFKPVEGGVLMTDRVSYKIPLGILGHIAQNLFVRRQLKDVFSYRNNVLDQIFPPKD